MHDVLVQFRSFKPDDLVPTLQEVADHFTLELESIDPDFGVIATDPREGLYTILVDQDAASLLELKLGSDDDPATGVFSNPRAEPFTEH